MQLLQPPVEICKLLRMHPDMVVQGQFTTNEGVTKLACVKQGSDASPSIGKYSPNTNYYSNHSKNDEN
eukprot:5931376-Amphidinium_carterae.1